MKNMRWFLLIFSGILYAIPFLLSDHFWWLIFTFPIPLLYVTRMVTLSFIHGYVWGCVVFALHLSGGIHVIASMAHESWPIGVAIGIAMILYQALYPALLFWSVAQIISIFSVQSLVVRLFIYSSALWLFIMWTDWYCMWIFGVQEGYPLMHPLIPLAHNPALLCLLPILGKLLLTGLFLLVPLSCTLLLWYKNNRALLLLCAAVAPWIACWWAGVSETQQFYWHNQIKSLPYMACSTVSNPIVVVKVVGNKLRNIIEQYPETEIIIMPESAFNVSNFADFPELLQLWNEDCLGKAVHFVFGASRWRNGNYYNSLHWVYNGVLQSYHDKKHAMLLSERLSPWMSNTIMRQVYFSKDAPIALSSDERIKFAFLQDIAFVPYICSELFFNELPDHTHGDSPIIAVINDSMFLGDWCVSYIQKLLVLLARYKAIQWQRDIVYVSYSQSLFIDKYGLSRHI